MFHEFAAARHAASGLRHFWHVAAGDPHVQLGLDGTAVLSGTATVTLAQLGVIHGIEEIVIGALVIVLLVLRIRSHLRGRRDD